LAKYIIIKIIKICLRYESYRNKYTQISSVSENGKINIPLISDVKGLLKQLLKDNTHVTLKLKQASNALVRNYFKDVKWRKKRNPNSAEQLVLTTTLKIGAFKKMIKDAYTSKGSGKNITQFIPASFYQPSIIITDGRREFSMSHMSSGQQHMIHSIHAVIYHLLNVDSLDNEKFKYRAVNILLDEIELYYHPEYQRLFVKSFLTELSKLRLKNIKGINILFSTHSPFILSDINHYNVLKLKDGLPIKFDNNVKTFGANIHTMFSDSFIMESTIGEFAKQQMLSIVEFYDRIRQTENDNLELLRKEYAEKRPTFKFLLNIIGEDVLVGALRNHLAFIDGKLGIKQMERNSERERLMKLRKKIDEDLKELDND